MRQWKYVVAVLLVSLCLQSLAIGNEALVPVVKVMGFSISMNILIIGIAVLIVFVVESVVLYARLRISYIEALVLSLVANSFSTLIGGVSFWISTSGKFIKLLYALLCAFSFAVMIGFFIRDSRLGKKQAPEKVSWLAPPLIIFEVVVALFVFLVNRAGFPEGYNGHFTDLLLALLAVGFIFSLISEGFVVGRWMSKRSTKIFSTVFIMNIISYFMVFVLIWIYNNWIYGNRP